MIAKVIVDVPLMQTDKPYSYQIPSEFEDMIEAGIRVHVPFGKANRLIQGIVIEVLEVMDTTEELKAIVEVLDYTPVLNKEQFWLADQLRKSVFSYKITILKTMLPSLLNSSYDKILYPQPSLDLATKVKLFGKKNEVAFSSLDVADQALVMRLVRKGDLVLEYKAKDKKQIKTEKWYRINQERLKELQPSARAKKRLALKERLLLEQGEQLLAGLYQDFSREVVA